VIPGVEVAVEGGDGLTLGVLWYSIAAMLTSLAVGLRSFCGLRFLLGVGEAANWPGATKAVAEWFPRRERLPPRSWGGDDCRRSLNTRARLLLEQG